MAENRDDARADGLLRGEDGVDRCWWHNNLPDYLAYHDNEWGRPVADETRLFEKLCLEGFQSGLSWLTILRKREGFRAAFAGFDVEKVAAFDDADVERLLGDAGIVRHRGKILAAIGNAKAALALRDSDGGLPAFVWRYEPDPASRPERLDWETARALAQTPESTALSKELKKKGFRFVGPTTVYAFMQAMGLVNDHLEGCALRDVVTRERARFTPPT